MFFSPYRVGFSPYDPPLDMASSFFESIKNRDTNTVDSSTILNASLFLNLIANGKKQISIEFIISSRRW